MGREGQGESEREVNCMGPAGDKTVCVQKTIMCAARSVVIKYKQSVDNNNASGVIWCDSRFY